MREASIKQARVVDFGKLLELAKSASAVITVGTEMPSGILPDSLTVMSVWSVLSVVYFGNKSARISGLSYWVLGDILANE